MLISRQRRFIFIHIQKTAGSSVVKALRQVTPDVITRFNDLPACWDPLKNRHLFASDLKLYLGNRAWQRFFKFAFVRNPWSRLVSWYNMCIDRPSNSFMRYVQANAPAFEDFLSLTSGRAVKTTFNQVDYICDRNGRIIVDFVGRFERLSSDFEYVCKQLAISAALPHKNKGPSVDYRSFYNPRTRQLVAERFRRDIDTFGYTFD